jgi:hypothetical protein
MSGSHASHTSEPVAGKFGFVWILPALARVRPPIPF